MSVDQARPAINWPILLAGAIVTTVIALSAHVIMLQGLGVPFPGRSGVPPWASFLNTALAVLALIFIYVLAQPRLTRWPVWLRCLLVAALFMTLKEGFRGNIMNGVVTTAWTVSAARMLPPLIYSLVLGTLVVVLTSLLPRLWHRLAAAIAIAALLVFAVQPLSGLALGPLFDAISHLDHDDVYPFPYGWYVLVWAYATFLEPVAASFILAALIWPGLQGHQALRATLFALLILLVRGALLPTFLFSAFNEAGFAIGMLSESQFLLEGLLLGLLTALTWHFSTRQQAASFVSRFVRQQSN